MSEAPQGRGQSPKGQESIDRRAWSDRRQWRSAGLAACFVAGLIVLWHAGHAFGPHDAATPEAPPPPGSFRVSEQQMKTLTIETVVLHGFVSEELTEGKIAVNGDRSTPVYSPYSGRVTRVIAGPGDLVKPGTPLAVLQASEFVAAQNDLTTAAAQLKIARINETRRHAVYDAKGGSLQDWQQAQADLTAAETALQAVRNRLQILGISPATVDRLEKSPTLSPSAAIVAPIGGVVVDRQVGPGQYLQSGSGTPLYTIADTSSVWLLANVREAHAARVHVGQTVDVRVLAYPGRGFRAQLSYVAASVDPATHRLAVRAVMDNADGTLKPEMFAAFRILTSDTADKPGVPESAVVYEGESAHVWVSTGGGTLAYRSITPGRNNDGMLEVLDGVAAGERIVTKGALFIDQAADAPGHAATSS